jgi:hypothetical protein
MAEPCIGRDRADLVLAGCAILEAILRLWPTETLRVADEMIGLIAASGLPADEVADVYYALTTFLFGFVAAEATTPGTSRYRALKATAGTYPNLARHRPAADHAGMDRRFEAGIRRFVASLALPRPARRARGSR